MTPQAPTTPDVARFGHHPDPATDYAVEVTCIESMVTDWRLTGRCFNDDDTPASFEALMRRAWRADNFRVGVVPEALNARRVLVPLVRELEAAYVR